MYKIGTYWLQHISNTSKKINKKQHVFVSILNLILDQLLVTITQLPLSWLQLDHKTCIYFHPIQAIPHQHQSLFCLPFLIPWCLLQYYPMSIHPCSQNMFDPCIWGFIELPDCGNVKKDGTWHFYRKLFLKQMRTYTWW